MTKNFLIYGIIGAALLAFVYFMVGKQPPKPSLPYMGIDSLTSGGDTVWHKVGGFAFTDQQGKTVTQKDFEGAIYVADFFFANCPGICKDMAVQKRRVYKAYKDVPNVKILSHTVDPERDSVPALMDYAMQQGVSDHGKWFFVTGNKKELYDMARNGYYSTATQGDGGPDDFVHTERFVLVDADKHIRGFYDGTNEGDVNKMMFDIDRLLKEQQP